jgi:hypothetical protein
MYLCIHVHVYIFMHLSMYFSLFLWDWSWNSWLQNEPLSLFLLRGFPNYLPVSDCQLSPPICCPDVLGKQGRALECLDELSEAPLHCTDPAVASGLGRPCHRASKARTWGTRRAALLRSGPASASAASVALGKCHPGGNASLQPSTAVLSTRKPLMDHLWAEEPTMTLCMCC